jgi:hypothetical protein
MVWVLYFSDFKEDGKFSRVSFRRNLMPTTLALRDARMGAGSLNRAGERLTSQLENYELGLGQLRIMHGLLER